MYSLNHSMAVMIAAFFVYQTLVIFRKVYQYEKNNGYLGDTICFMTSPKGFTIDWAKEIMGYSKWVVGVICTGLLGFLFYELVQQAIGLAMLYSFSVYMVSVAWVTAYNHLCGVKIGEKGLVVGVDLIEWDHIEAYSFGAIHKHHDLIIRMRIKETGSLKPFYIYINTKNTQLIMSLVKEYLVQ